MRTQLIFILIPIAAVVAGCVGGAMLWRLVIGGWAKRYTHDCGWFESGGLAWPTRGNPCPRCGSVDGVWRWRIGRPIPFSPIGWEWQADAEANTRSRSSN